MVVVDSVDTVHSLNNCYYFESGIASIYGGQWPIFHKFVGLDTFHITAIRATISCANETKACAPLDDGSNTTPGTP